MNRTFHARIAWYQYLLLVVLTANMASAVWCGYILPAVLLALVLIGLIEKVIHTVYTVTSDGVLKIYRGRFGGKTAIPLRDISAVKRCRSMKFGRFSATQYLLIEYGEGRFASVMPVAEEEFLKALSRRGVGEMRGNR